MKSEDSNKKNVLNAVKIDLLKIDFKSKYQRLLASARALKEQKEELRLAFEEMEDIYNNAPCGYHSLDDKGVFVRINDTELKWLGESRPCLMGKKKLTDVLTDESRLKFNEHYPGFMKTGFMHEENFDFLRKDGVVVPVLISASAIYDESGNYKMSRSVVVPLNGNNHGETKLRQSYEDLRQQLDALSVANENLSILNREKDHFIDIAAHDLQLPLAAVSMLSETLLKDNIAKGSKDEKQILEMIHDASIEMKSLLSNYLSASVSGAGSMDLFIREIDINVLIAEIFKRYIPIAEKKQIQLHFKNSRNFLVFTDRECCAQIIENLLSNAVKYTQPGKNITLAVTGNQKEVKIIVADEGPGIKKEERHLLFQRFQKLSARPTGGELSTGLGLSIVKYLVEQLHGSISVDSEPGKGSAFTVHLPLYFEG